MDDVPQDAFAPVNGVVVDPDTQRPLANRTIEIGGRTTITNASGAFTLAGVSEVYAATIVDPDGAAVSIYRGLRRRDPRLTHKRAHYPEPLPMNARISGSIMGGDPFPVAAGGVVAVYFFSQEADAHVVLLGGSGPEYGPIDVRWTAPDAVAGQLFTVARSPRTDAGLSLAWYGNQAFTLASGDLSRKDVALLPAMPLHVAGSIVVFPGGSLVQKQVFYRLPIAHAIVGLVSEQTSPLSFDSDVPDLSVAGAILCVEAVGSPGFIVTQQCGISVTTPNPSVMLQAPPSLTMPGDGAILSKGAQFAWSTYANGIHMLDLEATVPSRSTPNIHIFTSGSTVLWPDLASFNLPFPIGATYDATIVGLGPYGTIDDAVGPDGLGAIVPRETRRSYSDPIHLTTVP